MTPRDPDLAPRGLIFDVFGTLVDWRGGVAREVGRLLGADVDGGAFADAWRARYKPQLETVIDGSRPFVNLDVLHAESLDKVLAEFGLQADPATHRELVLAWHRLDAWPEVPQALQALRETHLLAPCSNAHTALSIALARRNAFPWDAILGAGYARAYKPDPVVYTSAAEALGLAPQATMLVACHSYDLAAAAALGLATAHVARPTEHGPGGGETHPTVAVDVGATDLQDLARQLA